MWTSLQRTCKPKNNRKHNKTISFSIFFNFGWQSHFSQNLAYSATPGRPFERFGVVVETFLASWARRAGPTRPQIAPRTPLLALLERPVGAPWPPYFEVWGLFGSLSAPCTCLGALRRPFVAKLALTCPPPKKDKITSISAVVNNRQCKMCPEPYVTY